MLEVNDHGRWRPDSGISWVTRSCLASRRKCQEQFEGFSSSARASAEAVMVALRANCSIIASRRGCASALRSEASPICRSDGVVLDWRMLRILEY